MGSCGGRQIKGQVKGHERFKGNANPKDYILEPKPIGKGVFCRVYKGTSASNPDKVVAVKAFNKKMLKEEDMEAIHLEARKLKKLDHPNIWKYYDSYEDKEYVYVVSEFIEGRTLSHQVQNMKIEFTEADIGLMFQGLFTGLNYMHSKDIFHRNIKPENIILDKGGNLWLIDFGLARITTSENAVKADGELSQYIAPEIEYLGYSGKSDIYAFGNVLYLVFARKLPYSGSKIIGTFKNNRRKDITFNNPCWKEVSFELPALIRKMLAKDPTKRISAAEALKDRWFDIVRNHSTDDEEKAIDEEVINALENFCCDSIFQKGVMNILATLIDDEEINAARKTFNYIDTDHNGIISFEELKAAMKKIYTQYSDYDVREIIKECDFSGSGTIDFTEFIAATLDRSALPGKPVLKELFTKLDKNKDGKIDKQDIRNEFKNFTKVGPVRFTSKLALPASCDKTNFDCFRGR